MNRIDRLQAILIQLQSKKVVKAQEIASRFEISLRTVYRDIRALEESGVPIGAEAGIGYFLMEGYHLPPVMFTNAEAHALLLGGKLIEKMTDSSVDAAFQSALYKVKSVLKSHSKEDLEDLEPRIAVMKNPATPSMVAAPFLTDIQGAIVQRLALALEYLSSYAGSEQITKREVEPVGLLYYGSGWHLIAWCRLRNDYRDFRVDRIRSLNSIGKTFKTRPTDSIQHYLNRLARTENLQEVVVSFDKSVVRYIGSQKYNYGYLSEKDLGDRVTMHFLTAHVEGLAHWLLMYTNAVTVESPDLLHVHLQRLVAELQMHYAVS